MAFLTNFKRRLIESGDKKLTEHGCGASYYGGGGCGGGSSSFKKPSVKQQVQEQARQIAMNVRSVESSIDDMIRFCNENGIDIPARVTAAYDELLRACEKYGRNLGK